ncbi:hypothetical protein DPMN_131209, partial [Dreissena polymorpha]
IVLPGGGPLMVGVSHGLPSSSVTPLLTGSSPISMPAHLISPGLSNAGIPNLQQVPVSAPRNIKEKKSRTHTTKSSHNSSNVVTSIASSANISSRSQTAPTKSRNSGSSVSYLSTFPKDLQKQESSVSKPSTLQQQQTSMSASGLVKENFPPHPSNFDPLEALLLSPTKKLHDKPVTVTESLPLDVMGKEQKLFQPFVSRESMDLNPSFSADSFLSPVKSGHLQGSGDMDLLLSTPQKVFPSTTENLFTSIATLSKSSSSEGKMFSLSLSHQDGLISHPLDNSMDMASLKALSNRDDINSSSHFYPGLMDPLNISPKASSHMMKDFPSNMDLSTDLKSHSNVPVEFGHPSVTSPKISPALPTGYMDTDIAALPTKAYTYGAEATAPKVYPSSQTQGTTPSGPLPSPSIDMAVNPLGTGYYNALTQKLIDPSFSMSVDFNKPSSSSFPTGSGDQKGKIYFENGTLINNDYDKISDTNDEDDLERILELDAIDAKSDNIDGAKEFEIEDLLNEFNEKQNDLLKSKAAVPVIDDFLSDVIGEAKPKVDSVTPSKVDEPYITPDAIELNQSAISELLDKEMEKIDQEVKEVDKSRLSASGFLTSVATTVLAPSTTSITTKPLPVVTMMSSSGSTASISAVVSSSSSDVKTVEHQAKKQEDPVDFEIPYVGKLMKIRKYQEIQKQKEQTAEKHLEVKVHEKKETVIEDKPQLQTILVQVSKRKKIEYGPYINKQSLLEGKPKNMPETPSPTKAFRPKPKPQSPVRRTFNLRERKSRPDFATLAGSTSRNNEGKKSDEKNKLEKDASIPTSETPNEEEEKAEETCDTESDVIVTRKREKTVEDIDCNAAKTPIDKKKAAVSKSAEKKTDVETSENSESDTNKISLRTRSAKAETASNEPKNLRKRGLKTSLDVTKTPPDVTKAKNKKTESQSDTIEMDENVTQTIGNEADEKLIRTRSKQKAAVDKTELKRCSVNLGEKCLNAKVKKKSNDNGLDVSKDEDFKDSDMESDIKDGETDFGDMDLNEDKESAKCDLLIKSEELKMESKSESIVQKEEPETKDVLPEDNKAGNIFERLKCERPTENTVVSISSSSDNKVTMKFRLGSDFHKAHREYMSAPKKRKFDNPTASPVKVEKKVIEEVKEKVTSVKASESVNQSEEDKSEKKVKQSVENEFQRLVNEAMEEVKKEKEVGETGKQERHVNLRKRMHDSVRYNVDESEDELDKGKEASEQHSAKSQRPGSGKASKGKGAKLKKGMEHSLLDSAKKETKKDMDVYDFTDTEMSDHEDSKSGFKPKYVSNLHKSPIGQKVQSSVLIGGNFKVEDKSENSNGVKTEETNTATDETNESTCENDMDSSYGISKTVEPLKIKLTKIKPFKEKKHKHKKKKKKRDRDRKDSNEEDKMSDVMAESPDLKVDIKSVESIGIDTTSNDGDDDSTIDKRNRKSAKVKEKKHICEYCNLGFSQKCDLRRHVMIHTGERPWPCPTCNKKFQRKTDLVKHVRTHTGEKPYACEFCDKRVSDKSQLIVHMRLHTGDRPYQCTKCGKRCITSSELNRHQNHCIEMKMNPCSVCQKMFKMNECLNMHMKLHHRSRTRQFKCDKCFLGFDVKDMFENHNCVDPSKSIFVCSECFEEFAEEMLYAEHIKMHDLGVLACNVCTLVFPDKHNLETHLCNLGGADKSGTENDKLANSSGDHPLVLSCEICNQTFQDKDSLVEHAVVHENDLGSFMCESCSEMFSLRKDFLSHVRTCVQQKPSLNDNSWPAGNVSDSWTSPVNMVNMGAMNSGSADNKVEQEILNLVAKTESVVTLPKQKPVRASVISGMFKISDDNSPETFDRVRRNIKPDPESVPMPAGQASVSMATSQTIVPKLSMVPTGNHNSAKLIYGSDFTKSPDFSLLTEDSIDTFSPVADVKHLCSDSFVETSRPSTSSRNGSRNNHAQQMTRKAKMEKSETFSRSIQNSVGGLDFEIFKYNYSDSDSHGHNSVPARKGPDQGQKSNPQSGNHENKWPDSLQSQAKVQDMTIRAGLGFTSNDIKGAVTNKAQNSSGVDWPRDLQNVYPSVTSDPVQSSHVKRLFSGNKDSFQFAQSSGQPVIPQWRDESSYSGARVATGSGLSTPGLFQETFLPRHSGEYRDRTKGHGRKGSGETAPSVLSNFH